MGKLTAYLAGVAVSLVLVYYYLSTFYAPLVQWVSPYLGPDIAVIMGIAFLFLGDPLHWPVIIAIWILLGVVVGIGARKGSRAVGAAVLVYYTIAGFLGLAFFSMVVGQGGSVLSGSFSGATSLSALASGSLAPPPGTNLYTILTEPLMGRMISVISIISGSLSTGGLSVNAAVALPLLTGGSSYYALVEKIILIFLPSMIANFALFLVVSGIMGWYLNRLINPGKKQGGKKGRNAVVTVVSLIAVLMVVSMLPFGGPQPINNHTTALMAYSNSADTSNSQFLNVQTPITYMEGQTASSVSGVNLSQVSGINYAAGVVGRYGDLYNVFSYVGRPNSSSPAGWAGVARNYSSFFTMIAFSGNISSMVSAMESDSLFGLSSSFSSSQGIGGTFDRYLNLIPGVTIVEDFPGNYSQTYSLASNESSLIALSMNLSHVSILASFTLPSGYIANISTASTLYLYGSGSASEYSEYSALNSISAYLPETGTYRIFSNGIRDGYLVPGSTDSSVNSSLMIVGYLNSRAVENMISGAVGSGNLTSLLGNGVYFAGGVFQKSSVFFSPPFKSRIAASEIMNYSSSVSFPSNATVYGLTFSLPEEQTSGNETYSYFSYSNINDLPSSLSGTGSSIPVNYSTSLQLSQVVYNVTQTFPAHISIYISTRFLGNDTVLVNTTFHTLSGTVINNFNLSEYGLISSYPGLVTLVSGQPNVTVADLGSTPENYSYSVHFKNPGTYVMPAPLVSYNFNGTLFTYSYTDPVIVIPLPSVLSTVNLMEYNSALLVSRLAGAPILVSAILPGFYVFDLIPLALVLIDIPLEYRWFRKTIQRRRAAGGSKP